MDKFITVSILTRSEMEVSINNKRIIIDGEATLTPAFYASKKSIVHWEPPHEKEDITEREREEIIQLVSEYVKDKTFKVYFE